MRSNEIGCFKLTRQFLQTWAREPMHTGRKEISSASRSLGPIWEAAVIIPGGLFGERTPEACKPVVTGVPSPDDMFFLPGLLACCNFSPVFGVMCNKRMITMNSSHYSILGDILLLILTEEVCCCICTVRSWISRILASLGYSHRNHQLT